MRWAVIAALALAGLALAGTLLLGAEAWLAARGPKSADPPPAPEDFPAGPAVTPGGGAGATAADGTAAAGTAAGGTAGAGAGPAPVVWLGDSTAAGVGASRLEATLPEQVALIEARPVRLTILARSGARVSDVLDFQLPQVARFHPTEVFVSVGANDAVHLTRRSHFRRDYDRLLAGLPASVTRVVLLGVPDMGGSPRFAQPLRAVAGWRGRQFATDVRNLARRRHAIFVDIAAGTGPAFRHDPKRYFASDHYHPNDTGYRLWATVTSAALADRR